MHYCNRGAKYWESILNNILKNIKKLYPILRLIILQKQSIIKRFFNRIKIESNLFIAKEIRVGNAFRRINTATTSGSDAIVMARKTVKIQHAFSIARVHSDSSTDRSRNRTSSDCLHKYPRTTRYSSITSRRLHWRRSRYQSWLYLHVYMYVCVHVRRRTKEHDRASAVLTQVKRRYWKGPGGFELSRALHLERPRETPPI